MTSVSPLMAGEIAGLPPHLVPTTSPDFSFYFGNDFLATGTTDDFRTQQLIATTRFGDRWIALLDHSTLTRADAVSGPPSRIDQMSFSLGYALIDDRSLEYSNSFTIGLGVRGVGNYEGARIQNGFHRLIESETSFLPYADTRQTDATAWFVAERHKILRRAKGSGFWSGWDTGYWGRAATLATADGQLDAVAGVYAIASRSGFDFWLGLRKDWREGYSADVVQVETAAEEGTAALSYGLRMGSMVLEVVQRSDSKASYGQLSFVSSAATRKEPMNRSGRRDLQLGLYLPHMMFQIAGRGHRRLLTNDHSAWRESVLIDLRGGQPQLGRDPTRFTETAQLTVGLEFSRPVNDQIPWLRFYGASSAGWRSEQLIGKGDLAGTKSETIGKVVLQADLGLEFDAVRLGSNWRHKLRFGLTGWLPASSETVMDGGLPSELQKPGASVAVAWTFNYY